jgi:hypothetical protein
MNNDRELLELSAKAAGIQGHYASLDEFPNWMNVHDGEGVYYTASQAWNPLTDDGAALRLAVKLEISVNPFAGKTVVAHEYSKRLVCEKWELHDDDPYAATRRAIVRVAAEIGKGMK